jgi:hypothetical protein
MEIDLTTDNPNPGSAPGMLRISRFSVPGRIPGQDRPKHPFRGRGEPPSSVVSSAELKSTFFVR